MTFSVSTAPGERHFVVGDENHNTCLWNLGMHGYMLWSSAAVVVIGVSVIKIDIKRVERLNTSLPQ